MNSPSVTEGGSLVYTVNVTGSSSTSTTVNLTLAPGATNPATFGGVGSDTLTPIEVSTDGGATWTTVVPNGSGGFTATLPAGGTSVQVRVPTFNDTFNEPNETLNLSASIGAQAAITGIGTINDNDARNVTKVTLEDTTATFTAADFGLVAGDTGVRIDTTTPGAGQLLLNGVAVSAGTVVSVADINAGLLTYSPAGNGPTSTNLSGNNYASFTFSVRDASNVFDLVPNNVTINVTPDADTPTISVAPATVTPPLPASQGLTWLFSPSLAGADSSNAGNTAVVESAIDAAGGTSSLVTNVFLSGNSFPNGIGTPAGLGSEVGGQNDANITATDNAHQFTGFVYLQAGQTATFSGFRDDTMRIELGGTTVFNQGFNNWGPFSSSGFVAPATGFYSVEIIYYNGDGPGGLNVNFSTGGAAQDLASSNFLLLPNAAAVTALGSGVVGSLVPNGEPGAGYYPAIFTSNTWVDLATTVNFPDNDGSETRNITVTGLPAGFELRDGVNTVTSTGAAINITTWNLANLEARPSAGYTGTATLTFTATATEQGNSDTASSTDTVTLTVTPTTVTALDAPLSGSVIAKTAFDATADESAMSKSHAQVFEWHLADGAEQQSLNIDVVNDFQVQADSLDLRDLLVGESHLGQDLGNLANFLSVSVVGGDTEIRISSTGGFQDGQYNSSAEDQRIVLDNVDLVASLSLNPAASSHDIIAAMLNNGKLITD
ncbi:MAG: type I secretion C-terminal target domain-containing protein [Rhizobacter sp.]